MSNQILPKETMPARQEGQHRASICFDPFLRGSVFQITAQILIRLLGFVSTLLVANGLGPNGFGQTSAVIAFGMLALPLMDLGVDTHLIRLLAKDDGSRRTLVRQALLLKVGLGVAVTTVFFLVGLVGGARVGLPEANHLLIFTGIVLVLVRALPSTWSACLRADGLLGWDALAQTTGKLLDMVFIILALNWQATPIGALTGFLAAALVQTALYAMLGRPRGADRIPTAPSSFRLLVQGGIPFALTGISVSIYTQGTLLILAAQSGDQEAGWFRAASLITIAVTGLSGALAISLFSTLSSAPASAVTSILRRALSFGLLLGLPVAVGGTITAQPLINWLFKPEYAPAAAILQILVWWVPVVFLTNLLGNGLGALGHQRDVFRISLLNVFVSLGLASVLVPMFGGCGAAIVTLVTETVGLVFLLAVTKARQSSQAINCLIFGRTLLATTPLLALIPLRDHCTPPVLLAAGCCLTILGVIMTGSWRDVLVER